MSDVYQQIDETLELIEATRRTVHALRDGLVELDRKVCSGLTSGQVVELNRRAEQALRGEDGP